MIQMGIYHHAGFFSESTAEWAGQAVIAATGGAPPPNWYPYPDVPLDCVTCTGGYHGSIFWEYLSERFGTGFAHEAYDRNAALAAAAGDHQPHDLQALSETLAAHGSSLADAMNGYALAAVAGQITRPGVLPSLPVADQTFALSLPIAYPPFAVTVDHLALKRIAFVGAGSGESQACLPATLGLRIDLPPGIPTQPAFVTYPPSGEPPAAAVYPLEIAGGTASAGVPWQTCASSTGSLVLPNPSTDADGQAFTVHLTVDSLALSPPALRGKGAQDVDKLALRVTSNQAASLRGQASAKLAGKTIKSKAARANVVADGAVTMRFRFAQSKLRAIKRVLADGKRVISKIEVTAIDEAGGSAAARTKVKLKP